MRQTIRCPELMLALLCSASTGLSLAVGRRSPVTKCSDIQAPTIPGVQVLSVSATEIHDIATDTEIYYPKGTIPSIGHPLLQNTTISVCDVNVTYTHPGVNDTVRVEVYLPLENWNGRFQANGGGGFTAGYGPRQLESPASFGFATANTNGGDVGLYYPPYGINPNLLSAADEFSNWGLGNKENVNLGQFADFASRGLHEMAMIGKAVTESFYGTPPAYSYYAGCSTGGRMGYTIAQRYPNDFDGVLANAPGIFWNAVMFSFFWPHVVMQEANTFLSQCELKAFDEKFIEYCDGLDGVIDGVVADPDRCDYDPAMLLGKNVLCEEHEFTITEEKANVVRKIHEGIVTRSGRKLWFGYNWGTDLFVVANTTVASNGTVIPHFSSVPRIWIPYFLEGDLSFDLSGVTVDIFVELMAQSGLQWDGMIGTTNPDLTAFRDAGGKLLTWHGMADENVPPNGTLYYRNQVDRILGGNDLVNDWYRVFLAPGGGHCAGGYGPVPIDSFAALMSWVEDGKIPETLPAGYTDKNGTERLLDLCPWPRVPRYDAEGDPALASSYSCAESFERPE